MQNNGGPFYVRPCSYDDVNSSEICKGTNQRTVNSAGGALINFPKSTFNAVFVYNKEMKSLDVISVEYRGIMFNMAS